MAALNSIVSNGVATGATYLKFNSRNTNINMDKMVSGNTTIEPKERVLGSGVPRFTSCTDSELINVIEGYYNNTISLDDIKATWHVGDTRTIHLNAIPTVGANEEYAVNESHRAQDIDIMILGFNHDQLVTPINGHEYALVTVQIKDVLLDQTHAGHNTANYYDGSTNTENGNIVDEDQIDSVIEFCDTPRGQWLEYGFYPALPYTMQYLLKPVWKTEIWDREVDNILTTTSKIYYSFLLSMSEVRGVDPGGFQVINEGEQYEYYVDHNHNKYPIWENDGFGINQSCIWWLRTLSYSIDGVDGVITDHHPIPGFFAADKYSSQFAGGSGAFNYGISPAWCM